MAVYLIHFERKLHHAGHYLGFAEDVSKRLQTHQRGRGARLLQVLVEQGIGFEVVRVWADGDRTLERKLKKWHKAGRLCPIFQQAKNTRRSLQHGKLGKSVS